MERTADILRIAYEKRAGEFYFLKHGGNILDFDTWWEANKNKRNWSGELDFVDADAKLPVTVPKPTSCVVVSLNLQDECIVNPENNHKQDSVIIYKNIDVVEALSILPSSHPKPESVVIVSEEKCMLYPGEIDVQPHVSSGHISVANVYHAEHINPAIFVNKKVCNTNNNISISSQQTESSTFKKEKSKLRKEKQLEEITNDSNSKNQEIANDSNSKNQRLVGIEGKRAKPWRSCCFHNCGNNDSSVTYTFPPVLVKGKIVQENLERCKIWIQCSGNKNLCKVSSISTLNQKYYVCSSHFADTDYYNKKRKRLLPKAVPSINLPDLLCDVDMDEFNLRNHFINVATDHDTAEYIENNHNENPLTGNINAGEDEELVEDLYFDSILTQNNIKDRYYYDFQRDMEKLHWNTCETCKESFVSKRNLKRPCLHNSRCDKFSGSNDMDPGDVPEELKNLSYLEEQLIARVHPLVSLYKIKGHQYGYSGNVINFFQDVNTFAKQLPHKISDLTSVITIRSQATDNKKKDFHVNAAKIKNALYFLKENNPYYSDIEISEENLSLLPDNGNVMNDIPTIPIVEDETTDNASTNNDVPANETNEDKNNPKFTQKKNNKNIKNSTPVKDVHSLDLHEGLSNDSQHSSSCDSEDSSECSDDDLEERLDQSYVPISINSNQKNQIKKVLDFPTLSKEPLSEFKTEGFICQAFPTLFPYGKADINSKERKHKINPTDYFQHLLRYKDRRFQEHPRFRFYAMNCVMRWNAIEKGSVYVKKSDEMKNMSVDQLKKNIEKNPHYLDKLMYSCANMRGSRAYWKARSKELLQMIEQLGMPTLFFTLSAADFHWPGLFKILAPDEELSTMTEKRRRELIATYPIIADKYFSERVFSFITRTIKPKYKVIDYWYRFEYQHRGSPHVHGILWLEGAPDVLNLKTKSDEEIQFICDYFHSLICAVNPNLNAPPAVVHPSRIELEEVIDLKRDLAELLNRVQRHTICTPGYCIKNGKSCRFKFPKPMCSKSEIKFEGNDPEFTPERNDPRLNKFGIYIMLLWRANHDLAPVLSKRALVSYLAKYVSKSENSSEGYQSLAELICTDDNLKSVKSAVQKLFIRACSDRDYSAQEVGHLIMGEKLFCTDGREFVYIYLQHSDDWVKVQTNNNIETFGRSIIQKYMNRQDQYADASLWTMAKTFNFSTHQRRKREAIVMVIPLLSFDSAKASNEKYFKQQVLLHVPWHRQDDFPTTTFTWEQIYNMNIDVIKQNDPKTSLSGIEAEVENAEPTDGDEQETRQYPMSIEEWMAVSAMGPNQRTPEIDLGNRNIDSTFNWNTAFEKYSKYGTIEQLQTFITSERSKSELDSTITSFPKVTFSDEQQKIISLARKQIQCIKKGNNNDPTITKSLVVQGPAGTGKSVVIQAITHIVETELGADAIVRLALSGVAASHIAGSTLNSKLSIPVDSSRKKNKTREFENLKGQSARKFCNAMKNVKFVIIDEYSMVGCAMLGKIDRRLKQATGIETEYFGGLYVYLFGDVNQLPPIIDTPLYSDQILHQKIQQDGKLAWINIPSGLILKNVHRQSDVKFKQLLTNISKGKVTEKDYEMLQTRFSTKLSSAEKGQFQDALRIFPTKKEVHETNMHSLRTIQFASNNAPVPIALINAQHNNSEAVDGTSNEAGGLCKSLYLGPTCRIILRANLWTEKSLVNGALGRVVDLIYKKDEGPPHNMPAVIVCQFDNYHGPYLGNNGSLKLVPIPVISRSWTSSSTGQSCTRTMFPIEPAYAVTIHKSQGLTLSKAIIGIGDIKEIAPGSTYVAVSRVKSLEGLSLNPFSSRRFLNINNSKVLNLKSIAIEYIASKSNW